MSTKTLPNWIIQFFFITGLFSATLFRLIIFLNRVNISWARLAWYIGVFGYILFFGYRYYISKKRRKAIIKNMLIEKVNESNLDNSTKEEVEYILHSIIKSREILNYIYIFITSALAVVVDIALTILNR